MFLALHPMGFIFLNCRFARASIHVAEYRNFLDKVIVTCIINFVKLYFLNFIAETMI